MVTLVREEDLSAHQDEPLIPNLRPTLQQVLAVLSALAQVIGQRLGMLLFGGGAFALAWRALDIGTPNAIWTLVAFAILVFCPTIWLNFRKTPAGVS